jgi:hypothetical protein
METVGGNVGERFRSAVMNEPRFEAAVAGSQIVRLSPGCFHHRGQRWLPARR